MNLVEFEEQPIPKPIASLRDKIQSYEKKLRRAKKELAPEAPFEIGDKVVVEGECMKTVYGVIDCVVYNPDGFRTWYNWSIQIQPWTKNWKRESNGRGALWLDSDSVQEYKIYTP